MLCIERDVSLAERTTLELGGPARFFTRAQRLEELAEAFDWANQRRLPATVLGGGSNVVVSDEGFPGLVIAMEMRGMNARRDRAGSARLQVAAGERWDDVVAWTVARGLAGLECLSGIPGSAGATPIQNVGAYGQEVSDTIESVHIFDRACGKPAILEGADCAFGYRTSLFRRQPNRYVVLSIVYRLREGSAGPVRYAELAEHLEQAGLPRKGACLDSVRQSVLGLRRRKSMVIEPGDPNRRSAGSFFTNPVVSDREADRVEELAVQKGMAASTAEVPRFPLPGGGAKLSAAWLIERSGVRRGMRSGNVGISSRHSLALVHHGGGSTRELLDLARSVRARVREVFDVTLDPEPVLLGSPPLHL